jgi:hypothetical protein
MHADLGRVWMSQQREQFVRQLEEAANHLRSIPTADVSTLLRRAAVRLRNISGIRLDADVGEKLAEVSILTGTEPHELATMIIRDWLVTNGYLPFHDLDEDTETDGMA